jgi:hypothetical protein
MKILEKEFDSRGFHFTQIARKDNHAIYQKVKDSGGKSFEVIQIRNHDGYEIAGVAVPPAEMYPSSESWGTLGFTYLRFEAAKERFEKLSGAVLSGVALPETKQTVTVTEAKPRIKRGEFTLVLPDGEFTLKELADKNGTYAAFVYPHLHETIAAGKAVELRRESRGRGRPTAIYQKT